MFNKKDIRVWDKYLAKASKVLKYLKMNEAKGNHLTPSLLVKPYQYMVDNYPWDCSQYNKQDILDNFNNVYNNGGRLQFRDVDNYYRFKVRTNRKANLDQLYYENNDKHSMIQTKNGRFEPATSNDLINALTSEVSCVHGFLDPQKRARHNAIVRRKKILHAIALRHSKSVARDKRITDKMKAKGTDFSTVVLGKAPSSSDKD